MCADMKIKVLIICFCVIIIGVLIGLLLMNKSGEDIKNIKRLYFTYTKGYMANSGVKYELENDKNGCKVTIKPYEVPDEDEISLYVSDNVSKKVEEVLNKYNVVKWDGFKGNDPYVLDGDSFSMTLTLDNDEEISASGYMDWPDNYMKVRNELDDIFMEIYHETDRSN